MNNETIHITCGNCGYDWDTKSKARYTTCPKCLYKVPVKWETSNRVASKLDTRALENWLWDAACSIRGAVDAPKFKDFILPLVFIKRLSDVFDDEVDRLIEKFGNRETALELVQQDHGLVRFYIPEKAKWNNIRTLSTKVGERVTDILRLIAKENPKLQGVIDVVDFNVTYAGQRVIDDARLQGLIESLSDPRYRLGLKDVEPDILGRAYEYLLRKFAEGQGQSAGEFFTPKEVGWLIARIMNPEQGQSICDPTCGSGGLLVKCQLLVQEKYQQVDRPLQLFGQESNHVTYAMARMNMIVHDMEGEITIGDTLRNPKLLKDGRLTEFDIVVANPMWMQTGYNGGFYENDPFGRFWAGYPPANSADWGWIQHMFTSLKRKGRAGIVIDTGAVSRGTGSGSSNKEREIRKEFIEKDFIEGVILLPGNLFYNTPADGIILILNKNKPDNRKDQIILINAGLEFEKGRPKNFIPDEKILKIANAFHQWKNIEGFAKIVSREEAIKMDYNLVPSRYVGPESATDVKPLVDVMKSLANAERNGTTIDNDLNKILLCLGVNGERTSDVVTGLWGMNFPTHWNFSTLGELFDIQQGKALNQRARQGDSLRPFLRTANVLWCEVDVSHLDQMHFDTEERNRLRLQSGDLLVCEGGDIGRTAMWRGEIKECYHQNHVLRLRPKTDKVWPEFYLYWMHAALSLWNIYVGRGNRTTIPNLSKGQLAQFEVPVPPLSEQREIVRILAMTRKAQLATKEELKQLENLYRTLLNDLLAGRINLSNKGE